MKAVALVLLLALPAWADDAPRQLRAFPVTAGYVVTEPAWLYTEEGKARVDARIARDAQVIANQQKRIADLEAQPALTWKGALLLIGGGIVIGAAVAIPISLARR